MASQGTIQDYAKAINSSWRKTTDSVLETAKLCAEADKNLPPDQKNKLFDHLDFTKATFSKLVKIGSQPRLQTDAVRSLLPPNYTIVYEVAKLRESDLQVAIKEGVITPKMSRGDLDAWLAEREGRGTEGAVKKERIIATLRVPSDYDDQKEGRLEEALEKLRQEFGIAVERPRDPEAEAYNRMVREIDEYIRKGARQYIRKLKATKLAGKRHLTPAKRKKLWNFGDDETEIRPDATWEQVQYALDMVASPDQFERLRDEAFRLHGVSEKAVKERPAVVNHEEAMKELWEIVGQDRAMGRLRSGGLGKIKAHDFSGFK
jgi:hypothetical protein